MGDSKDIRESAMKFIAHRAKTSAQVLEHLTEEGYSREEAEKQIREMKELRYIDDAGYAFNYMEYAFEKGRAFERARIELEERGVSRRDIERAAEDYCHMYGVDIREEDRKRAAGQAEAFAGSNDMCEEKNRNRLGRKLLSLGYDASIVIDIVDRYR